MIKHMKVFHPLYIFTWSYCGHDDDQ